MRGEQNPDFTPDGAPAQRAGHAPSATAEGYAILSMDELRPHAEAIERHFLSLAGVQFDASVEPAAPGMAYRWPILRTLNGKPP